jgi:hypothetical protein
MSIFFITGLIRDFTIEARFSGSLKGRRPHLQLGFSLIVSTISDKALAISPAKFLSFINVPASCCITCKAFFLAAVKVLVIKKHHLKVYFFSAINHSNDLWDPSILKKILAEKDGINEFRNFFLILIG